MSKNNRSLNKQREMLQNEPVMNPTESHSVETESQMGLASTATTPPELLPMIFDRSGLKIVPEEEVFDTSELSDSEVETLSECETVIETGIETFVAVAKAIHTIWNGKLYRDKHRSFEKYLHSRWNIGRAQGYRFIDVGGAIKTVEDAGQRFAPKNLNTAVEMSMLPSMETLLATNARANEAAAKSKTPRKAVKNVVTKAVIESKAKAPEAPTKPTPKATPPFVSKLETIPQAAPRVVDHDEQDDAEFKPLVIECYEGIARASRMMEDGVDLGQIGDVIESLKERLESIGVVQRHIEAIEMVEAA